MKHIRLCTAIAVSLLAPVAMAQSSTSSSQTTSNSNASNAGANSSTNTSSSTSTQNALSGSNAANNNSQNNGSASSVTATINVLTPTPAPAAATTSSNGPTPQAAAATTPADPTTHAYVEYGGTQTIKNVPSMNAPPLVSSNDTCMGSASGGVAVAGFGFSGGATYTDEHCKRIKMSRELWNKGMKAASLALDCMDRDAREALELTGFVCPQTARAQRQAAEEAQRQAAASQAVMHTSKRTLPAEALAVEPVAPVAPAAPAAPVAAAAPVVPPPPAPAPAPVAVATPVPDAGPLIPVSLPAPAVSEQVSAAPAAPQERDVVIRRVDGGDTGLVPESEKVRQ